MSEIISPNKSMGTSGALAVCGLSAMMAASPVEWPDRELSSYSVSHVRSSYSPHALTASGYLGISSEDEFAREIVKFYHKLADGQEPLGAEFEAVWDANVESLYES